MTASEIQEIKITLSNIKQRADRFGFSSLEQASSSGIKDSTWLDPRVASRFISEDEVLGIESVTDELTSKLLAEQPMCRVISLVGMGGLGKTTLAKKLYDSLIGHFDWHAWIDVPQYKMEDLLKTMVKQFYEPRKVNFLEEIDSMKEVELIEMLRRYLGP